nr:stage III sporulation protein AF [uncultured Dorea sp.]
MSIIDTVYNWVKNLAFFAILSTAVLQMIPDQGFQKYVRFFTGLLMVSMLILPIFKVTGKENIFTDIYKSREYREQLEENSKKSQELIEQITVLEQKNRTNEKDLENDDIEHNQRIEVERIEIRKDGNAVLEE